MVKRVNIFDAEPQAAPGNPFANDVVGRFHGGYLHGKTPKSLDQWRVVSDDPNVIARIADLYGGEPQEVGEGDDLKHEVFTNAESVNIIIESPEAVSCEFILWGQDHKIAMRGDGVTLDDGTPDPGAALDDATRRQRAKQGLVPAPTTEVYFRLADAPGLGIFRFVQGNAWSLERDLHRTGFYDALDDAENGINAELRRKPQSFVAKTGPMAGKTVSYTSTQLRFKSEVR